MSPPFDTDVNAIFPVDDYPIAVNSQELFSVASTKSLSDLQTWRTQSDLFDTAGAYAMDLRYMATLSFFVDNPRLLRDMLRITASVVSGSCALHVLDLDRASIWEPTDLDIYTPRHGFNAIVDYLCDTEQFSIRKVEVSTSPYQNFAIEKVVHLSRGNRDIDVIQSTSTSALEPLPHFWSSHLMNYLSADGFCVAYPTLTLSGRGLLNPFQSIDLEHPTRRSISAMLKYSARGYDFRTRPLAWAQDIHAECDADVGCARTVRFFGDIHCLVGAFTPASHLSACEPNVALPDPHTTVRWTRGGRACGGTCKLSNKNCDAMLPRASTVSFPCRP